MTNSPNDIQAAWRGEELLARSDWHQQLSSVEATELAHATANNTAVGREIESLAPSARSLAGTTIGERLTKIQHNLEHGSGACLLTGLNLEDRSEDERRRWFWAIASHLGTPVSQSAAGERIFSVRDEGFKIGQPQARGPNTSKRLSFHTDRCDVIAFLCLQQAKSGGENQIASSRAIYEEMRRKRPDLVETLQQPFYYARHNVDAGNDKPWCRQPIFSFCEGYFACSYLRVLIDRAYAMDELPDMTDKQREALDMIEEIAADPEMHITFRQKPGDLLLLNNWITLHRREEFEDFAESERRRHILRIWLAMPNSRPLDPLFAENYGTTAAGAIRGGMQASSEP